SGNSTPCTVSFTVVDNTPPTFYCKPKTVFLDATGHATVVAADVYQSGSDNCGTVNLFSVSPNSFTCANIGLNAVTLTVNDGHGNAATCTATVTVVDNTLPTVTCTSKSIYLDSTGHATIAPADVFSAGSDNCGTVNLVSVTPNSFDCTKL